VIAEKCPVCGADRRPLLTSWFCPNEGAARDHAEWRAAEAARTHTSLNFGWAEASKDWVTTPAPWLTLDWADEDTTP